MAVFKQGQQVRIVETARGRSDPEYIGMEAVVVRCGIAVRNVLTGRAFDDGVEIHMANGQDALVLSSWIEPVINPGHEACDWAKSLTRPDGTYNPSGDHLPIMTPEFVRAWGGA